ncbi:hypothetical protein [Salinicoccus roseus]|uniref:Uncharacterized protein n=1 Tax=Salinicoccus roseus TaxID=45670 RepID=A0ABT4YLN4_9STAP|nr:hypothetical protein [Salinicoccus roseus]MDB0581395.1 hypothetical protein [Salinicoccus roseus]
MSNATEFKKHLSSLKKIKDLYEADNKYLFIHYACQSFNEVNDGISPRIHSIAVRLEDEQTELFSVFQTADDLGLDIYDNLDRLEKEMLEEFYSFAHLHSKKFWVHWSMTDTNYGFPAITNRAKKHKIDNAFDLGLLNKIDLSVELKRIYGDSYVSGPNKFPGIVKLNNISGMARLEGVEEPEAFNRGEFGKVHQSILKKVNNLQSIFNRIALGTLITESRIRPNRPQFFYEKYNGHWLFYVSSIIVSALVGIFLGYIIF